ncbi:MAG: response regulator, partial [Vicinamibacterales bacterium]|nr:response regulator [Vicinamibacterales bacterium]
MVSASEILNASILVVDDQEADVSLLERTLRGAGYTSIASTRDPHEVCELQRTNRYCLILLDLQMPGMDGFQVMEGLKDIEKDDYRHLPILVMTAQPGHKVRALQAGAKDFISKPFDLAELLTRVCNMLEAHLLRVASKKANDLLEQLMAQMREANERLIVGTLRAQTMTEVAEEANHLKDEFLATVSHELRTPLNAIVGWARILGSKQSPPDLAAPGIAAIERNAWALAHIIDDLLDMSRIATGNLHMAAQRVDLVALAQRALDTVRP